MKCIIITKKIQKLWIWETIDHRSKNLIGWSFGHRDTKALIKTYDRMKFLTLMQIIMKVPENSFQQKI